MSVSLRTVVPKLRDGAGNSLREHTALARAAPRTAALESNAEVGAGAECVSGGATPSTGAVVAGNAKGGMRPDRRPLDRVVSHPPHTVVPC